MKITLSPAVPSLVVGAGRLLDWGGRYELYRSAESAAEADEAALASDWSVVGDLLYDAIEQYRVSEVA